MISVSSCTPPFLAVFLCLLLLSVGVRLWLAARHMRHIAVHRDTVPVDFRAAVPLPAHRKAADYTLAGTRLGMLELVWGLLLLAGWTLLGGLNWLNQTLLSFMQPGLWQQLTLLVVFAGMGSVLDLPFGIYRTFVLEERFGFNRTTWRQWLKDALLGALVGAVLGLPIAALVLWLMGSAGALWWLWAWAALIAFNLLILFIYPAFIAPLFNRFEPLENQQIKTAADALMQRCGFHASGFYVMDGSRRSGHANAYFTGFGRNRRVVFFDTLLEKLSVEEIEAVLAHELGHFRHRHIVQRMVLMFASSLLGFAVLGFLSQQQWFYTALGVMPAGAASAQHFLSHNGALALILFLLTVPVFTFFFTALGAQWSRRHEFQADAYAVEQTSGQHLGQALLKLYTDNASTLTPDPLYVRFYYSHPPASERLQRMGYQPPLQPQVT